MDNIDIITRRLEFNNSHVEKSKAVIRALEGLTYGEAYDVLKVVKNTLNYGQVNQPVGDLGELNKELVTHR